MSDLDRIEQERAARKEALALARAKQRAIDIAALNDLEIERGDDAVVSVDVGRYAPGMQTLVVTRGLSRPELKRFRDRTRKEGSDAAAAAEEAADSCVLYPARDSDAWAALKDAVPGLATRVGVAAVHIAAGMEHAEAKK